MKEIPFEPHLHADGTLDPTCLERMGPEWVASWMRERLSGRDRYFPLDRRTDEDPETLISGWVRSLGSGHPLSILLSRAARLLLEEARSAAPAVPDFLSPLLHLCQQVALPETTGWFLAELTVAAERPQELAARWPERRQRDEILFAALRQAPGWPGSPARPAWQGLLSQPESTTFALSALGSSLEQQLPYLAIWWRTCPPEEREIELEQFVFEAWSTGGQSGVRELLQKARNLPPDLQAAIDQKLQSLGANAFFASTGGGPRITAAIQNACWEHKYLIREPRVGSRAA